MRHDTTKHDEQEGILEPEQLATLLLGGRQNPGRKSDMSSSPDAQWLRTTGGWPRREIVLREDPANCIVDLGKTIVCRF